MATGVCSLYSDVSFDDLRYSDSDNQIGERQCGGARRSDDDQGNDYRLNPVRIRSQRCRRNQRIIIQQRDGKRRSSTMWWRFRRQSTWFLRSTQWRSTTWCGVNRDQHRANLNASCRSRNRISKGDISTQRSSQILARSLCEIMADEKRLLTPAASHDEASISLSPIVIT